MSWMTLKIYSQVSKIQPNNWKVYTFPSSPLPYYYTIIIVYLCFCLIYYSIAQISHFKSEKGYQENRWPSPWWWRGRGWGWPWGRGTQWMSCRAWSRMRWRWPGSRGRCLQPSWSLGWTSGRWPRRSSVCSFCPSLLLRQSNCLLCVSIWIIEHIDW